uniref:Uncharacterized protein n=1 Tax=Talaromyces marneffei PM1 TaxID=1077442 RepID=A0A093VIP3_TALMA
MSQKELNELRKRLEEEQRRREEAERKLNLEILQTRNTTLPEFLDAFVTERHFTPLLALRESGKDIIKRMHGSELDIGYFQRETVESRVASVVEELYASRQLRRKFNLRGNVTFENHANTLTDESRIVTDMSSLRLEPEGPRRSERQARRSRDTSRSTLRVRRQTAAQPRRPHPRADQFCVYNRGPDEKKDESPEDICRRVVAAVITQLFYYMYEGGNEYGCVATGEAFIFLRVPHNNPSTVLYYLSEIEEKAIPASDYRPPLSRSNYYRQSPVKTRSKSMMAFSCEPSQESRLLDYEDDADDSLDPSTPSRAPRDSRSPWRQATAATNPNIDQITTIGFKRQVSKVLYSTVPSRLAW